MTAPTAQPLNKVAQDHYATTQSFVDAAAGVAAEMWSEVDPDNLVESWVQQLPELNAVVSGAQLGVARQSDEYVGEALETQGLSDESVGAIQPAAFAGTASDGRGLMTLLANPVVVTLLTISDIHDVGRAMGAGRANLDMLVRTQVADAGRAADQVSLVAHPAADGYIRQTDGNPCARCLILAGKRFQWNQGFLRHPRCGCTHVPAGAGVVPQDPMRLYRAMSQAERIRAGFTRAEMRALEEGADIGQVVNARRGVFTAGGRRFTTEGTTRRGLFGQVARQQDGLTRGQRLTRPRLTPEQIYREAGADRAEAIRLLQRNGYLLPSPSRGAGGLATPGPATQVRKVLADAQDPAAVSRALEAEYTRITGRTTTVDLRGSVETAREHAEGVLRMVDQYPELRIAAVRTGRTVKRSSYAEARHGDQEIVFAEGWSSVAKRQEYLEALAADARAGFHPAGFDPSAVAIHETAHLLDTATAALDREIDELLMRFQRQTSVPLDRGIRAGISEYAAKNHREMIAESFADVMVNGAEASGLSRAIVRIVERQPGRGRGGLLIAGETLPSAVDLSRLPVTRLQAMVREHGITVPTGLKKPALVRLADDLDSGVPAATARERAVASIVDERRGIADALTRAVEVEDLSERAMRSVATALRRELSPDQVKTLKPLLEALDAGDSARVRAAIPAVAKPAKLRQIGEAGAVVRLPAGSVEWIGPGRSGVVSVVRPGWETTVERRVVLLQRAAAQAATPEQAARLAPVKAAKAGKKAAAPAKRAADPIEAYAAEQRSLAALVARADDAERRRLGGGQSGEVFELTLDGTRFVEKTYTARGFVTLETAIESADREELAALVMHAVGVRAPVVVRPDRTGRFYMEFVDGRLADDLFPGDIPARVVDSADGRLLGLADTILRNNDRKGSNWLVDTSGRLVGLDHGHAFGRGFGGRRNPFMDAFVDRTSGTIRPHIDMSPADVAVIRARVAALRPEFERLGHLDWHGETMAVLDEIAAAARGTRSRLTPVAPAAKKAAKAAPAKTPAPPAPSRMSAPALRKELTDRGVTLDTPKVPKPVLAEHVARLRSGSPAAAETARLRQAVIDRHRAAAETLAEAVEILDIGAEALAVRARARLRRIETLIGGWLVEAPVRALLTAMATGNPAAIRRAIATAERRLGLKRVDAATMDRTVMQPTGGTIRDGARVEVVRPGYTVEIGGERVVLSKAVVREVPVAPRIDDLREIGEGA